MKRNNSVRFLILALVLGVLLLAACNADRFTPGAAEPTAGPTAAPTAEPIAGPGKAIAETSAAEETAASETPAALPAAPGEKTPVYAATTDELLKALRPDTEVHLTGRSYNLSQAFGYGNFGGDYYSWSEAYDGYQLTVYGLQNFSIVAEKPGIEVVAAPRYAAVIRFESCQDLRLDGFTAGHTDGAGTCTGAVLNFANCSGVEIEHCDLYGCGTYGVEAERCRELAVRDSVIRDCSYGAVSVLNSSAVRIDGCTVYGIENYNGVFWFSGSSGAVTNCLIRNCTGSALAWSNYSQLFFGGCEVSGNTLNGMFWADTNPITVEGCAFRRNEGGWYFEEWSPSLRAVRGDGEPWEDFELAAMELEEGVSWAPPAAQTPDTAPVEPSADGMIHVTNVDELLASIAPGVTIYLEDGVYDLSRAVGYGSYTGDAYYYWMNCYDGPGLVLRNLDNFTLTAGGPHRASITAEPRFADVISFETCSGVTLSNFTAGHAQEPGDCAGGVLNFVDCSDTAIQDCSLYGCGVLGVSAYSCRNLAIRYTEIHHCSYGAFSMQDCINVSAEHCNIHDIPGYTWYTYGCRNVTMDGESVPEGTRY